MRDFLEKLQKCKSFAISKQGKLLSQSYLGANIKLKWECKKGHVWTSTPSNILNAGNWCQECLGRQKITIDTLKKDAAKSGGFILSKKYLGRKINHEWKCSQGHIFFATPNAIRNKRRKSFCKICIGIREYTIDDMKFIAKKNGGDCLSDKYVNNYTKLKWTCSKNHVWESIPSQIIKGSWCSECLGKKKFTINTFREIAQKNGGECLSSKFVNVKTKLLIRCNKGHEWEPIGETLLRGNWCPYCSGRVSNRTIEDFKKIAIKKNGKCLSTKFINQKTKLKYQCERGHEFEACQN